MALRLHRRQRWDLPSATVWGFEGGHDDGAHPRVLVLHGLGGDQDHMRRILDPIAARRRIVAYDHPGFGPRCRGEHENTMTHLADVAAEVIEHVNDGEPMDVVANSMGGLVAMGLMARHPQAVRRAVLLAPAGPANHSPWQASFLRAMAGLPGGVVALPAFLLTRYHWLVGQRPADVSFNDAFSFFLDKKSRVNLIHHSRTFLRTTANLVNEDQHLAWAARVPHPVLLVHGTEDELVPLESSHQYLNTLPNARLLTLPGAGHDPVNFASDDVFAAVWDHLGG